MSFLHNVSYVELEPLNVKPEANVTITFATEQENGVLLYVGDYQHLAVELFRGRIRVSYDIGNNPVSTMFSYEILSDGQYHRVELLSIKKNFTLRVDGGLARSIVNEGDNEFLQVEDQLFFLLVLIMYIVRNIISRFTSQCTWLVSPSKLGSKR